jgi:uncharacterized membrane protein YidH (DUF202 family)
MKIAAILPDNPENYDINSIKALITNIGQMALTIVGGIAIIYIILGGYQYFTAFGNEEKATKAKTTITWAIVGIVVIILAKVILMEVWSILTNTPPDFFF